MNLEEEQEGGLRCNRCGRVNEPQGVYCADCGMELESQPRLSIPKVEDRPRRVVLCRSLLPEDLDRLWGAFERALHCDCFPERVLWPSDDDSGEGLYQELPEGTVLLSDVLSGDYRNKPVPGWLDLVSRLASTIDALHRCGCRLNSFGLNSLIVTEDNLDFVGLCLPMSLSFLDTPRSQMSPVGLDCCFASPELQGYVEYPPSSASDVYNLALLTYYLMVGESPKDLLACHFCPIAAHPELSPAVRACMEEALAMDPALRPQSAEEFVKRLRRSLVTDLCRCHFGLQSAWLSDVGIGGRENNEDACGIWIRSKTDPHGQCTIGVVAVADGMGGGAFGERASAYCIERLLEDTTDDLRILAGKLASPPEWADAIRSWVLQLNQQVIQLGEKLRTPHDIGSTLTALLLLGSRGFLLHVGDSRLYLVRGDEIVQLTSDQTYAEELYSHGQLNREEADKSIYRHVLTSFVGSPKCAPQVEELDLTGGDVFVLCTDGLTEGLPERDIFELSTTLPPEEAVVEMIRRCKHHLLSQPPEPEATANGPQSDNISVVVLRISEVAKTDSAESFSAGSGLGARDFSPCVECNPEREQIEGESYDRTANDLGSARPS